MVNMRSLLGLGDNDDDEYMVSRLCLERHLYFGAWGMASGFSKPCNIGNEGDVCWCCVIVQMGAQARIFKSWGTMNGAHFHGTWPY